MPANTCEHLHDLNLPQLATSKLESVNHLEIKNCAFTHAFNPEPPFVRVYIAANLLGR